jgi:hypothetical protein
MTQEPRIITHAPFVDSNKFEENLSSHSIQQLNNSHNNNHSKSETNKETTIQPEDNSPSPNTTTPSSHIYISKKGMRAAIPSIQSSNTSLHSSIGSNSKHAMADAIVSQSRPMSLLTHENNSEKSSPTCSSNKIHMNVDKSLQNLDKTAPGMSRSSSTPIKPTTSQLPNPAVPSANDKLIINTISNTNNDSSPILPDVPISVMTQVTSNKKDVKMNIEAARQKAQAGKPFFSIFKISFHVFFLVFVGILTIKQLLNNNLFQILF